MVEFAGMSGPAFRATASNLSQAGQRDALPDTRRDFDRCVPQSVVAAAFLSSPGGATGLLQALQPPSGSRLSGVYQSVVADQRDDGVLTSESLERVGELLFEQYSREEGVLGGTSPLETHRMLVGTGAELTRPVAAAFRPYPLDVLNALDSGEFAIVQQPFHAVMVTRSPDDPAQWLSYDPLRRSDNLQQHPDLNTALESFGRVNQGVSATFRY